MKNGHDTGGQAGIVRNLQEAIGQLHRDLNRVEIWAGALTGFMQPVPEYRPGSDYLLSRAAGEGHGRAVGRDPEE